MDLRSEFPIAEKWAFLNHAAVAPLSRAARDKLHALADLLCIDGSIAGAETWREVEVVRAAAARLLRAPTGSIAFVASTSAGISTISEGFPWQKGDNVVLVAGEFPANVYPWMHLANRGVELRIVPLTDGRFTPKDLEARIDSRTRLLSVSQVQYHNGFRCDLSAIGELCRRRGVDFFVDAIQGLGVFPIDVDALHIDFLAADGHKWLCGPEGAGLLYVRPEKLEKIRPTCLGWKSVVGSHDYATIDFRLRGDSSRFEAGSFNVLGILSLGASLQLFEEIGASVIEKKVRETTDELVAGLNALGTQIHSPRDGESWSGIVSFSPFEVPAVTALHHLRKGGVVVAARGGRLRVSPHCYNNSGDLERLFRAMESLPGRSVNR
jgi:selenocysteine lyase/cysteine desulfurase